MDYSQTIDDHENLQDYNPPKKNVSSVWYDNRLVLRERKLNISLVFISILFQSTKSYKTKCNTFYENT